MEFVYVLMLAFVCLGLLAKTVALDERLERVDRELQDIKRKATL